MECSAMCRWSIVAPHDLGQEIEAARQVRARQRQQHARDAR